MKKSELFDSNSFERAQVGVDKTTFAKRWGFSLRTVDNFLAQGMPHLAVGRRRVRIVVMEADAWMQERFGTRRRAQVKAAAD